MQVFSVRCPFGCGFSWTAPLGGLVVEHGAPRLRVSAEVRTDGLLGEFPLVDVVVGRVGGEVVAIWTHSCSEILPRSDDAA